MDFFIVLCLLGVIAALVFFSFRVSDLQYRIRVPERHLQKMTEDSLNELCTLLRKEGVPKELVEMVRNRKLVSRTTQLSGFTSNPSGEFIELIRGAEELIDRQYETGEDLSEPISALLKLAKTSIK